ncbi:hypothetical protein BS47DRAFT_1380157 [Hydnum rufescens UP504]|uniref:Uncharacterized protein n=1 Tax=Hydnum rufescens UP504 TaxID=1448309 RepID=A0A9P6B5C8_9AGAM|nr:hypothetical protein BS47DRAFT_1380157 [Hydnum rufescens UP504]
MLLVAAWLPGSHSSYTMDPNFASSWRGVSMMYQMDGRMMTSVISSGLSLTQMNIHRALHLILFDLQLLYLLYSPDLLKQIAGIACTKLCYGPKLFIMNPWSKSEILQILPQAGIDSRIFDIFNRLGPTPRLCLLPERRLNDYEDQLNQAIQNLNFPVLEKALMNARVLQMDDMSHKLCLVTRKDRDNVYSRAVIHLITDWVKSRLALQLRTMEKAEQLRLMRMLSRVSESRPLAGVLFEAMAQSELLDGITLNLMPMVKKPDSSPQGRHQPQWHSSHILIPDTLDTLCEKAPEIPRTIEPDSWKEYSDNGLSSIEPNVMYVPQHSNEKAIDSFILVDDILHLFQFTIGSKHDINNHGLVGVGEKYGFPKDMAKWRFTFIIPPNTILKIPQAQRGPLKDLEFYSAVLDVGLEIQVE